MISFLAGIVVGHIMWIIVSTSHDASRRRRARERFDAEVDRIRRETKGT
jgi:hypothetical protein